MSKVTLPTTTSKGTEKKGLKLSKKKEKQEKAEETKKSKNTDTSNK